MAAVNKRRAPLLALLLSACLPPPKRVPPPTEPAVAVSTATALRLLPPDQWPEIKDELDLESLRKAAAKNLAYLASQERKNFQIGSREVGAGLLAATLRDLIGALEQAPDPEALRRRLIQDFELYQSVGSDGKGKVIFSAYYQPTLRASLSPDSIYRYPLYRKPPDMVEADLGLFNPKWKGESILGRISNGKLVPYFDRRDIDVRKVLQGKELEIAWLADPFDRLDIHIQGSGILELPDKRKLLAKFAATNALPYRSVGLAVVGSGAMSSSEISHERLRQYLLSHPEGEAWLISQNPRYTFFELKPLPPDGEPFGTIEQSLTAGRSIAIDPKYIPLGAVAFFKTVMPQASAGGELLGRFASSRFALCQDTGGAIKGPGRVDIYVGHGAQAKTSAVNQWAEGQLYILLRKLPPRQR